MRQIGSNRETNDSTIVLDGIEPPDDDAIELLPANPSRLKAIISVREEDGFVRLMGEDVDSSTMKGIFAKKNTVVEITGAMHTGPISGIVAKNGKEPTFFVTEV